VGGRSPRGSGQEVASRSSGPSENTPKILFAAVRRKAHVHVMEKGLFSDRPLVLSPDRDMALRIGRRRDQKPIMLEVMTGPAQQQGVSFYAFGDLYLAREIPAEFISGPPVPEELRNPSRPRKRKTVPQPSILSGELSCWIFKETLMFPQAHRKKAPRMERGFAGR